MNLILRPSCRPGLVLVGILALVACGGGDAGPPAAVEAPPPAEGAVRAIEVEEAWRWSAPPPGSVGMPEADADGVAAAYGHLRLVLLDLDGGVRWEVERRGLRDVAPALTADLVVAATEKGVMAVERSTGKVRWDTEVGERANSPVVAGDLVVVSTWESSLTAFHLADGRVAWRAPLPGPAIGPAATDGDAVVVTWESKFGDAAGAVAVDGADGRQRWSVPLEPGGVGGPAIVALPGVGDPDVGDSEVGDSEVGDPEVGDPDVGDPDVGGGPEVGDSVVVLVAGDLAAHGLGLADGAERWRTGTDGRGSPEVPPLPLGGGEVLVAHRLAGLDLLDAATGEVQWGGSAGGAAVRGGPDGPGPDGPFAFPTDDGRLLLVGPGWEPTGKDWPGRVSGVTMAPDGLFLVATREARENHLIALTVS